ncbi:hypothetical protein GCM10023097_06180 [Streptomyces collinus]
MRCGTEVTVPVRLASDTAQSGATPGLAGTIRTVQGVPRAVTMLLCAPRQGTEILTGRIPVGIQNGDSAKAATRGANSARNISTYGGKRGSNASLEGLAG